MSRVNLIASTGLIFNEDKSMVLGVSRKDDKTKFGLPGGKYSTEVCADWMSFKFLDEKDAFLCKIMLSEHL